MQCDNQIKHVSYWNKFIKCIYNIYILYINFMQLCKYSLKRVISHLLNSSGPKCRMHSFVYLFKY